MRLWSAAYVMQPRGRLGSRATAAGRPGALLRLETPEGALGYADLFPWPELKDAPLPEQLATLARGETTPLGRRSLACARDDATARAAGRSLLAGLPVPPSHYLVTDRADLSRLSPPDLLEAGFDRVKWKLGADLEAEIELLAELGAGSDLRWRLDLNAAVSCEALHHALEWLQARWAPASLAARIDFLEDPCPYAASDWQRLRERFGIGIALDREETGDAPVVATHRVIKPAAEDPETSAVWAVRHGLRIVVTSYLDHPVGQVHAARVAGELRARYGHRVTTCGLLSHSAYAPNAYSEALPVRGAGLDTAGLGPGIGLESLLEAEQWVPLCP